MNKPDRLNSLATDLDIDDPVFAENFEDALEHLVAHCPVAHSNRGPGYHAFNRYEDVRRSAQNWRAFTSADGWMLDPPEGNIHILPEDCAPPYHTNWRRVLNPFFTAGPWTSSNNTHAITPGNSSISLPVAVNANTSQILPRSCRD